MRERQAVQATAEQHGTQRQKNAAPVEPDTNAALHRHRQAKNRQRVKRLVLQTGLDPAHFNNAQRFTQHVRAKCAQCDKDKTADSGKNQHKTAGHGITLNSFIVRNENEKFLAHGPLSPESTDERPLFYPVLPDCHDKPDKTHSYWPEHH